MSKKFLLSSISLLFCLFIFAQETSTITGKIVDDNTQGLPGANVVVKGTTNGTVTDDAGNYTLQVKSEDQTLVISYVGYAPKEVAISSAKAGVLNISLSSTINDIEQIVVSASKKKEKILDAPASVSVLGQEKLERNVVTTPVDQLKNTPGVDVMRTGLVSSNVSVRGFNNIFSGSVLNVIDNRIGAVPSLRVNAYQLVPTSNLDFQRIEVVRGPASALYGPNASSGVVHIITKSPLDQKKKFETTVAVTSGFTVLDKSYQTFNNGKAVSGNIINPEIRHSGKLFDGKFGYKISANYFQGKDYPNYDPREPYDGDSLVFGSARNGVVFTPDTLGYSYVLNPNTNKTDTLVNLDVRRFKKDFTIRKFGTDARIDIAPIKDIVLTINGGVAGSHNIELTGLGAGSAGGTSGMWIYWYLQARFKWKDLYIQYFINSSDAGNTYLIPQLSESSRRSYDATSPPTAYQVQKLIDKSKLHGAQIQHSVQPIEKLSLVYGADLLFTQPDTKGTINGRFEDKDNLLQTGTYVQGDYDPLKWLKFVAAFRIDYNSIIKGVSFSPRAGIVFKPAQGHNIRITYNRAFDSPTTLNQFLDLSNGYIPNGINVRGIGNPYGWQYKYDDNTGVVQFKTAPYGQPDSTHWITYGDKTENAKLFEQMFTLIKTGLKASPGADPNQIESIFNTVFSGIRGAGGTVANADFVSIDYANFATTKDYGGSLQNVANFKNLDKIGNSTTQTLELGYKGLIAGKLSLQVDGYWTRISNYVSALTTASGAVTFDWKSYLGDFAPGGKLYDNLYANGGLLNSLLLPQLNGNPSLQNPSIVAPDNSSVWDELVVLMNQLPVGTITPDDPKYVGSDFIVTYKNLGRLDVFGIDFGAQYNVYDDARHSVSFGGSFSWVDKDQIVLSSGETVSLNAPKYKASLTFDHELKKTGFAYGLSFRYQNGYYANSAVYFGDVKPMYLLDARVSYRPSFYKDLLLSVNVNNVTNYQWRSFPGTPLMGTQFYARAQVTF